MKIEQKQNSVYKPKTVFTLSAEETNQVTTELENLIAAGGLTPDENTLTQVRDSVAALYVPKTAVGAAGGVAPLNASAKIDSAYLPSYVDDVIDTYIVSGAAAHSAGWLSETAGGPALTPEAGKLYVVVESESAYANRTYRWSGSVYVQISGGGGAGSIDNLSITQNANSELQTVGVINQNDGTTAIKKWSGTKAEYDALATKDDDTEYSFPDEGAATVTAADTDLSNLSAAGEEKLDGEWTAANIVLNSSDLSIAANSTKSFDISSYFESGKVYELLLSLYGKTGASIGNNADFRVSSTLMTTGIMVCGTMTRTKAVVICTGSAVIPYNGGSLTVHNGAAQAVSLGLTRINAYRRVK